MPRGLTGGCDLIPWQEGVTGWRGRRMWQDRVVGIVWLEVVAENVARECEWRTWLDLCDQRDGLRVLLEDLAGRLARIGGAGGVVGVAQGGFSWFSPWNQMVVGGRGGETSTVRKKGGTHFTDLI